MKSSADCTQKNFFILPVLVFFLSILFLPPGRSQAKTLRIGLKASSNVVWMKPNFENWKSDAVRLGYNYGLMAEFGLTDNYCIATGLEFSQRGGKLLQQFTDTSGIITQITETYKLQYIDIPFTLKMKTNEVGYITYFGQFGVISSVNIKARGDIGTTVNGIAQPDISNRNISGEIIPVNFALTIGAGIEFSIVGKTALLLGLSYNKGLTDVLTNQVVAGVKQNYKSVINSVVLNAGILF